MVHLRHREGATGTPAAIVCRAGRIECQQMKRGTQGGTSSDLTNLESPPGALRRAAAKRRGAWRDFKVRLCAWAAARSCCAYRRLDGLSAMAHNRRGGPKATNPGGSSTRHQASLAGASWQAVDPWGNQGQRHHSNSHRRPSVSSSGGRRRSATAAAACPTALQKSASPLCRTACPRR